MSGIARTLPPEWCLRAIDRVNTRVIHAAIAVAITHGRALRIPEGLTTYAERDVAHRVRNKMPAQPATGAALRCVRQIAGIQDVHDLIACFRALQAREHIGC